MKSTRIGLFSLVDHMPDAVTGRTITPRERLLEVIEQAVLAEAAGFERFAVGEHHFTGYILPSAGLLLSPIAVRTSRIRLFTTVTLLALYNPIQLAEEIGVLDQLSNGRIELSFARGVSSVASEVFGVPPEGAYELMESHLVRLLAFLISGEVAPGQATLVPRTIQRPHPRLWIGGGLHAQSCDLAVKYGLPLILPSLFRYPDDYLPMLDRYREGLALQGLASQAQVGLPSYCWVAPTSQQARAQWRPRLDSYVAFARTLRSGFGRDLDFDSILAGPGICGSPAEVVDKLSQINEKLKLDSHILLMDVGGMPFDELRGAIELFGTHVLPQLQPPASTTAPVSVAPASTPAPTSVPPSSNL